MPLPFLNKHRAKFYSRMICSISPYEIKQYKLRPFLSSRQSAFQLVNSGELENLMLIFLYPKHKDLNGLQGFAENCDLGQKAGGNFEMVTFSLKKLKKVEKM